ncbi:MAG: hypothetical protein K2I09_08835 [Duncaniella sp.]|nr:hypothetical protein [Duncaniella sp.]
MSRNYNDLLRLTYEIEGLLLLQSQRAEGDTVPAVDSLIAEKTALLTKAFSISADTPSPEKEQATYPATESSDSEATAISALAEEEMMATEPVAAIPAEPDAHMPAPPTIEATATPEPQVINESIETPQSLEEKLARERARDIFRAFTLNDKFRFRRELFRNSQDEFDETLNVISQMSSITEAEEYIFDDLCWDPDNEDVKAFMDVVAKHF